MGAAKTATVIHGPQVWRERQGVVVSDDGEVVVLHFVESDGLTFDVSFPRACLKIEDVPVQA